MNAVTILRIAMALVTGALGVLGTIIETKHKTTRRVTKGGWVVLSLILVSMVIGMFAQVAESTKEAREKKDATMQTLALVTESSSTLKKVERLLTPIGKAQYAMEFNIDCHSARFSHMCAEAHRRFLREDDQLNNEWELWPGGGRDVILAVFLNFYSNAKDADKENLNGIDKSDYRDLSLDLQAVAHHPLNGEYLLFYYDETNDRRFPGKLFTFPVSGRKMMTNGRLYSAMDLHGAVLQLEGTSADLDGIIPEEVQIRPENAPMITVKGFQMVNAPGEPDTIVYRATVP